MDAAPLSRELQRFVVEHIDSMARLELLLLLHRDPHLEWTAEQASREMRYPSSWAAAQLEDFSKLGWVVGSAGADRHFRYRARERVARLVDELADTYTSVER